MELLEIRHLSHIILYGQHETTHFLYVAFATDVSVSSVGVSYLGALCSDCIRDILCIIAGRSEQIQKGAVSISQGLEDGY